MRTSVRVAVVGGGVIGLACALSLQRAGANVTVFDQTSEAPPASAGNAGHIATEQVEPLASPAVVRSVFGRLFMAGGPIDFRAPDVGAWGPWAVRFLGSSTARRFAAGRNALRALMTDALPAWRRLVEAVGEPDLLDEAGHLVLWESPRTAAIGRDAWSRTDTGLATFEPLGPRDLAALHPTLRGRLAGGLRFHGTGQVSDPGRVLDTLRRSLMGLGGIVRAEKVAAVAVRDGRASLNLEGAQSDWDQIVVAAGIGSGALMRSAGHFAPMIAERGYHLEGRAGEGAASPPTVFADRSIIVTRFGDRLRVAGFVEFARANAPPDPRKWARLRRHINDLGLPVSGPFSRWMGARPTFPDYLPAIGVSQRAHNLIYAFGHQHLGLTLAPRTAELVAQLVASGTTTLDLAPFDLSRFDPPSPGPGDGSGFPLSVPVR
jgi:D-amino-acid dehydrogenase